MVDRSGKVHGPGWASVRSLKDSNGGPETLLDTSEPSEYGMA